MTQAQRHVSFGATTHDLQHLRTVTDIHHRVAVMCAALNARIDDEHTAADTAPAPGEWPASYWAMTELVALRERTREIIDDLPVPEHPIPPMRWAPWGRIVVRRDTGPSAPCWYDPDGDPWATWTDEQAAAWPYLAQTPDPMPQPGRN